MKKKTYKKKRKKTEYRRVVVFSLYMLLASLSVYFIFKSYQYISNIPEANNITQEEIYDLTRIGESDIKLIRALKNDAFDSWLYEANEAKAKQLPKTKEIISSIVEGEVKVSDIDQVVADLQKNVDVIHDSDIEELYVLYYKAVLFNYYEKANNSFQKMTLEQSDNPYKEAFDLLDLLNKIKNQKGMQSVMNAVIFKQSISLLEEMNHNFKEVNDIQAKIIRYDSLTEPIPEPETRLGEELGEYVSRINNYIDSKLIVREFERRYEELQLNLDINKELIKKSNRIPDLVGLTVEEAQQRIDKEKINLTILGYTNGIYRNGERVPETLRNIEPWDEDKEGIIIRQSPAYPEYEFIIEGSTIEIWVENNSIKQPQDTSESSSTSASNSSTISSSSSEDISTTTTSGDDVLN